MDFLFRMLIVLIGKHILHFYFIIGKMFEGDAYDDIAYAVL